MAVRTGPEGVLEHTKGRRSKHRRIMQTQRFPGLTTIQAVQIESVVLQGVLSAVRSTPPLVLPPQNIGNVHIQFTDGDRTVDYYGSPWPLLAIEVLRYMKE